MRGAEVLLERLRRLEALRRRRRLDGGRDVRLRQLARWQGTRLARTHADLLESPRYRPAVQFFLDDLYAPKDYSRRDRDLMKISPALARVLPESAVSTMGLALEMNVVTEELDLATDRALSDLDLSYPLTEESYAEAVRASGERAKRRRQIELIREVGEDLDVVVRMRWVKRALQLARTPAQVSGLGGLHDLLERGFRAFHGMGGAGEFLDAICGRELEILERIYAGHPEPFALDPGGGASIRRP